MLCRSTTISTFGFCALLIASQAFGEDAPAGITLFLDPTVGEAFQQAKEAEFLAAVQNAIVAVDFDDRPAGPISGSEWLTEGVAFDSVSADGLRLVVGGTNATPRSVPNLLWPTTFGSFQFTFGTPQGAVGFWIIDSEFSSGDTIDFFDTSEELLLSVPMPFTGFVTGGANGNFFVGVISAAPVHRVLIRENDASTEKVGLDELFLRAAPSCVAPPAGMQNWWRGEGDALDTQRNHDGVLVNGTGFAAGKVRDAFQLDGIDDYVDFDDAVIPLGAKSIDLWLNTLSTGSQEIYSNEGADFSKFGSRLLINSSGHLVFTVRRGGFQNMDNFESVSNATVNDGLWHHVAATWDGTVAVDAVKLYVDGQLDSMTTALQEEVQPADFKLRIGATSGLTAARQFDGMLDEIEVFDRQLTAAEVLDIVEAGAAGKCDGEVVDFDDLDTLGIIGDDGPPVDFAASKGLLFDAAVFRADFDHFIDVIVPSPPNFLTLPELSGTITFVDPNDSTKPATTDLFSFESAGLVNSTSYFSGLNVTAFDIGDQQVFFGTIPPRGRFEQFPVELFEIDVDGIHTVRFDRIEHSLGGGITPIDNLFFRTPKPDTDRDGVNDQSDNCTLLANADQRDTNEDGIGNACDPDLDNNCAVNFIDLGLFKECIFGSNPDCDFDGDGAVNFVDLGIMKASFFMPPGPSGVPNDCD